ncbi:CG9797, partial [Drosophila busckii]
MSKVGHKVQKNTCRICGKYASFKKSYNIFQKANQKLLDNVQMLTGLRLENYECMPELMCECCHIELTSAIRLRERCINAQRELLAALTGKQLEEVSSGYKDLLMGIEAPLETVETDNQEYVTDAETGAEAEPTTEVDIYQTEDEFVQSLEPQSSGSVVKLKYTDANELEEYIEEEEEDEEEASLVEETEFECLMADADGNIVQVEDVSNQLVITDPNEVYMYDSDDEVAVLDNVLDDEYESENVVKKSSLQPKPKNKTNNTQRRGTGGTFICDQCGNHIKGRMAFELHCRRHRGEKDFQCEICDKCFCTTSELKRHMRKHTGERPFACQYCGRCFSDYTTRVKHERTHTNERPYACGTCGKAFTTGYILKNHMLTHSGLRSYRCELCDKSFMLPTHLSTHMRTGIHKRTAEKYQMKQQMQNEQDVQFKIEMEEDSLHI